MTVTQHELDSFHRFATDRLSKSEEELTIDDLVIEWDSMRNREQINAAIREGLADVDAGRTRPADQVTEELRRKHNIPK
jgi:predicted transcriptional regulator